MTSRGIFDAEICDGLPSGVYSAVDERRQVIVKLSVAVEAGPRMCYSLSWYIRSIVCFAAHVVTLEVKGE